MSKIREKESLECVRMHIWASKTQKLPGPLSGPWSPAAECSLRSRDSASLRRQLSASEAGAPPDQILDPHLVSQQTTCNNKVLIIHLSSFLPACPPAWLKVNSTECYKVFRLWSFTLSEKSPVQSAPITSKLHMQTCVHKNRAPIVTKLCLTTMKRSRYIS